MRRLAIRWAGSFVALFLIASAGCIRVPPARITADRMDFGQVIQEPWKRQTLLNIVRMRHADVPMFLDIASVINSYSLSGNVTGGASVETPSSETFDLRAGGTWSNTPTVTYQPLMGERFTRSLLQPVPLAAVFQLLQGGLSPELVIRTVIQSVNGLRNESWQAAADPRFGELVDLLSNIQRTGSLASRVEARKDGSALIMILRPESAGAQPAEDVNRVRELLGLDEGVSEVEVVYGVAPRTGREVAMLTRSMIGIIIELGFYIELPADETASGRALPVHRKPGEARAPGLVRIQSGAEAPPDAYVAVPYKGHWYWIDDRDISSKGAFTFLMILFSLAGTGSASVSPVVTVPSR